MCSAKALKSRSHQVYKALQNLGNANILKIELAICIPMRLMLIFKFTSSLVLDTFSSNIKNI